MIRLASLFNKAALLLVVGFALFTAYQSNGGGDLTQLFSMITNEK